MCDKKFNSSSRCFWCGNTIGDPHKALWIRGHRSTGYEKLYFHVTCMGNAMTRIMTSMYHVQKNHGIMFRPSQDFGETVDPNFKQDNFEVGYNNIKIDDH